MLWITIPASEKYNEATNEFITSKEQRILLEHSLVSLSKWESRWHKPFLAHKSDNKSQEEVIDYIRCMTLTQNVDPAAYYNLTPSNYAKIQAYIDDTMTATTFNDFQKTKPNNEIITSELIYYWMIAYNVPVEFEKWHLNRLLTLIKVCSIKNAPPKKMSKREIYNRNAALNASRRKAYNSKG